jgi:hypothetical protein
MDTTTHRKRKDSIDLIAQYHQRLNVVSVDENPSPSGSSTDNRECTDKPPVSVQAALETCKTEQFKYDGAIRNLGRWDDHHDALLKTWKRQASINHWLQLASAYYYAKVNNWMAYPTILVSALTSVGIFASDDRIVKYVLASLSLASACVIAINKQTRVAEKAEDYGSKARELGKFIRDLNFLLTLKRDQRPDVRESITKLRCDFDRINDTQSEPPLNIVRMYEKNHKSIESTLYEELDELRRSEDANDVP